MTVDELIVELQTLSARGFGSAIIAKQGSQGGAVPLGDPTVMKGFVKRPSYYLWRPDDYDATETLVFVE